MGVLSQAEFWEEVRAGLGNRSDSDISDALITRALNLAQSRIGRSYDFYEMGTVAFSQMNFTRNTAVDKYLVPPPLTKTIHSLVILDTSSAAMVQGTGDIGSGGVPIGSGGVPIGSGGGGGGFVPGQGGIPTTGQIGSLGQSRKVVEKPWRWFDEHYPSPEWLPAGWPEIYKRFGNIITMVPAPFLQFTAQLSYTTFPTPFNPTTPMQVSDFENKDDVIINKALAYRFQILGRTDRAAYFEGLAKEQLDEAIERDDNRPDMEVSRDIPALGTSINGPYWAQPFVPNSP